MRATRAKQQAHHPNRKPLFGLELGLSLALVAMSCSVSWAATTGEDKSAGKTKKSRHDDDGYYGSLTPAPQQEAPQQEATSSQSAAAVSTQPAAITRESTVPNTTAVPASTPAGAGQTSPAFGETASATVPAGHKVFLYKATKGEQVVYLLGTIHVARPQFYPLPPAMDVALKQSDALVVEVALDRIDKKQLLQMLKGQAAYAQGDNLSKHLSASTRKLLDAYLAWAGESLEMYQEYRPWMVQTLLESQAMRREGYACELGIDRYLLKKAKEQGKPVQELETAASQLKVLSSAPEADQEKLFALSLSQLKDVSTKVRELERVWRNGDEPGLNAALKAGDSGEPELKAFYDAVLEKRNASMTAKLCELMAGKKTMLVAVGAGHLVGDRGIPALLKGKGFTVDQVTAESMSPTATPTFSARARKLQTLYYPEGLFSVSLPGNPDLKYQDMAGLRCVDYTYPEFSGMYQVSYLILPNAVNPAVGNKMYDAVVAELVKKTKGTLVSQYAITLPGGYAGRQIEIKTPATTGVGAKPQPVMLRLKLSLVGKRFYMIGGTGTSAWLNSPAVDSFMSSLAIRKEVSPAELARRAQQKSDAFHTDFDARRQDFDRRFAESQSRARRSFEGARADHERSMYGRR